MRSHPEGAESTALLAAGLGLGISADRLLWEGPLGPGLAVWIALLGGSAVLLSWGRGWRWSRATAGWTLVAVAAALGTAWRASPVLRLLFLGVIVLAGSQALLEARGRRLGRTRVLDHVYGLSLVPWLGGAGALPLLARASLPSRRGRLVAVGRGVLLAAAPVTAFALLFAAADPAFELLARSVIPDADLVPAHLFLVGGFGWVGAGLLAGLFPARTSNPLGRLRPPRLGIEETAVLLGLVAALFTVFVGIQFTYLFGGLDALRATSGLTLAEYARRGFFELVTVAGLVLALLLVTGAAAPRGSGRWVFRSLAAVLIALVLCVIASAALRLRLYIDAFGLTTARLYAAAAMGWIAVTLGLFAATVVRGRPRRFASGALLAGLVAVAGLAAVNPDVLVARTNLERASSRPLDRRYLAWQLSADAVPVLLEHLDDPAIGDRAACGMAVALLQRWGPAADAGGTDWRTFNAAVSEARGRVRDPAAHARLTELSHRCG